MIVRERGGETEVEAEAERERERERKRISHKPIVQNQVLRSRQRADLNSKNNRLT